MPEFVAEHVPAKLDSFTTGYLMAAEWLLDEEIDREAIKAWSPKAIEQAMKDCARFVAENSADLDIYYDESGRGEESAGHDFWLSRNGHGAGFFDRGDHPVFDRLQDVCRGWSEKYVELGDDGFLYFI